MKTRLKIRYLSGREEEFDFEVFGGAGAHGRLQQFLKNPTLALQTEDELIIIPSSAVESISIQLPDEEASRPQLDVNRARRVREPLEPR